MNKEFLIKTFSQEHIKEELSFIGFDEMYLNVAKDKYNAFLLKIYDLTPIQATILKQTALSVGSDCAVNREVLTHNVEKTDCVLFGTQKQLKEIIKKLYIQPFNLKILANNLTSFLENNLSIYQIRKTIFDWKKTYLMGILNCTPNSFSDGGEFLEISQALSHFEELSENGADIIDIGAESTAPNSSPITTTEELSRLENLISKCREINSQIPISIDTRNALTAKKAISLGVDIINDVSGLNYDEKMIDVLSESNAFIVLTYDEPIINNLLDETIKGLIKKVKRVLNCGIKEDKIILDVGLGFNKTYEQNFELIKRANEVCSVGFPVLYGLSRKSFVQKATNLPPKETEFANVSLASYLAQKGVNIIRVHDVLSHKIAFNALDKVIYD